MYELSDCDDGQSEVDNKTLFDIVVWCEIRHLNGTTPQIV